jgi:hypothetical protein
VINSILDGVMQWLHGKIAFDFTHAKKAIEQKQV